MRARRRYVQEVFGTLLMTFSLELFFTMMKMLITLYYDLSVKSIR